MGLICSAPAPKRLLHIRMREKRVTQFAATLDATTHGMSERRATSSRKYESAGRAVRILDRRTKNHSVKLGPQRIGHTHRAWLACGVHRKPLKGGTFQLFACQPDSASFVRGARIAFAQTAWLRALNAARCAY